METIILFAIVVLGVIALNAILGLLIAFPVLWIWNWLIPAILGLPLISYWQAYALYLLCAILFKSSSSSRSSK